MARDMSAQLVVVAALLAHQTQTQHENQLRSQLLHETIELALYAITNFLTVERLKVHDKASGWVWRGARRLLNAFTI